MRRFFRLLPLSLFAAGLVALYAAVGFLLLPYLIKTYGVPAAAEQLKHPVILREVAINPFTLSLRLNGLEVREHDETPILGFDELFIDLHTSTLLLQTIAFDEIRLTMPFVSVKVNREGKLNLQALMPQSEKPAQEPAQRTDGKKMAVFIDDLQIEQGIVEFRDDSKPTPLSIDIVPIHIALRNFSTVEGGENAYAIRAEIGKGETVAWEGSISLEPVRSDGKLTLSGLQVRTLYQAVQDRFQFDVQQGHLTLSGAYHIDLDGASPNVLITGGTLALRDLAIAERGIGDRVVEIPSFDVEGVGFDLIGRSVTIGAIRSAEARVEAWIDPDGSLNYQRMLGSPGQTTAPASDHVPQSGQPWSVALKTVEFKNCRAMFEDRTLARPSHLEVEAVNLTVKDVQVPLRRPVPIDLSLTLNQTGSIVVKGTVAAQPAAADLEVTLNQIGLRPFQPYLDRFIQVDVRDGAVDLAGSVHYAQAHPKGPLVRFQGNVSVNRFSLTDRTEFQEVASWKSLAVNRITLEVAPTAVTVADIVWQEPTAYVAINQDGKLNLSQIMVPQSKDRQAVEERPKRSGPAPASPTIVVNTVKLIKAGVTFRDASIQPPVRTSLTDLTGTIKGLSSKEVAKATVSLAGQVGAGAPLKISGRINPLSEDAFTDITLLFENLDLTTASPYAGKYAGYPIDNGKLFLDLKYKIAKKALNGENKVLIDQLTFGEKTNSPEATSLPVPLAVALLKDRKGQIDVDLPVRGDLNDPDFKYGRVVLNAVLNLLAKVATSPLSLLGGLIGGAGDELNVVAFAPGQAELSEAELKKLTTLEKVLTERPGLFLEITGTADPAQDRPALAEARFLAKLLERRRAEASGVMGQELSREEESRSVNEWYGQEFGNQPAPQADHEPTMAEKRARLVASLVIGEEELRRIAQRRAETIRARLAGAGTIPEERLVMRDVQLKEGQGAAVQAALTLAGR